MLLVIISTILKSSKSVLLLKSRIRGEYFFLRASMYSVLISEHTTSFNHLLLNFQSKCRLWICYILLFPLKTLPIYFFLLMHKNHRLLLADSTRLPFHSKRQRSMLCLSKSGKISLLFSFCLNFCCQEKSKGSSFCVCVCWKLLLYTESLSCCARRQDTELLVASTCPHNMRCKS